MASRGGSVVTMSRLRSASSHKSCHASQNDDRRDSFADVKPGTAVRRRGHRDERSKPNEDQEPLEIELHNVPWPGCASLSVCAWPNLAPKPTGEVSDCDAPLSTASHRVDQAETVSPGDIIEIGRFKVMYIGGEDNGLPKGATDSRVGHAGPQTVHVARTRPSTTGSPTIASQRIGTAPL
jgi:hypothetical protein